MNLSNLLQTVVVGPEEQPFVAVDPGTRFVYVATEKGPERVDSNFRRVVVPVHPWQATGGDETTEIIKVLLEASATNPLKVASPKVLDDAFWIRQRGWKGMVFNPKLRGRFPIPDGPMVVTSAVVPENLLLLIGTGAGFYVRQGLRRGVVSNRAQSLMQVQFFIV